MLMTSTPYLRISLVSDLTSLFTKFTNDGSSSSDNNMLTGAILIILLRLLTWLIINPSLTNFVLLIFKNIPYFGSYLPHRCQCVSFQCSQSEFMIMEKVHLSRCCFALTKKSYSMLFGTSLLFLCF